MDQWQLVVLASVVHGSMTLISEVVTGQSVLTDGFPLQTVNELLMPKSRDKRQWGILTDDIIMMTGV